MKICQLLFTLGLIVALGTGCATRFSQAHGSEYTVQPRDTGAGIARTFGLSVAELEALNPGVDWQRLKVGQKMRVR